MGSYRELVVRSARQYMEQLAFVARSPIASKDLALAAGTLRETLHASIEDGALMAADQVTFSAGLIDPLMATGEWRFLLNPWTLGFGSDVPRVVALGTEGAATPSSTLGLWDFSGAVAILSNGSGAVLARLAAGLGSRWENAFASPGGSALYHQNPSDVLRRAGVSAVNESRHTWALIARAIGPKPVDEPGDPSSIWKDAYLIERSSLPAKVATGGSAPSPARVAFLCELVSTLRDTSRVLLLYGHNDPSSYAEQPNGDLWAWANREVTRAFLGVKNLTRPQILDDFDDASRRRRTIGIWRNGGRAALWTWALSGRNVTDGYLRAVREQVDAL